MDHTRADGKKPFLHNGVREALETGLLNYDSVSSTFATFELFDNTPKNGEFTVPDQRQADLFTLRAKMAKREDIKFIVNEEGKK